MAAAEHQAEVQFVLYCCTLVATAQYRNAAAAQQRRAHSRVDEIFVSSLWLLLTGLAC